MSLSDSVSALYALSPIDGRYAQQSGELNAYFSEYALIRYRVLVEVEYFIALCEFSLPQLPLLSTEQKRLLSQIYQDFSQAEALEIKEIEKTTNHDVKAVEYFLKARFKKLGLEAYEEFIHFGLTSQDINNTATPLLLKEAEQNVLLPFLEQLIQQIEHFANLWANVPMLAYTHGQPASPTRVGKELQVFAYRLRQQLQSLKQVPFAAKFGGATGNFNAHVVAYPALDWQRFAQQFVENNLGLKRALWTTQIENYDHLAARFDAYKRLNTILIDFCRDIWAYISMNYFKQKIKAGEIGSSAMPHKVNPIDFENAEGNLGIANAILEHLAAKLPISRLQRDLTDSTVLRNIGVPLAHGLIAWKSILKGLSKLELHEAKIEQDLENNWAVVAEAIQTILRREGYPKPYEALKELTRTGKRIEKAMIEDFIESLQVETAIKEELKQISPSNYVGL
ncbi:adenylosuccinate lyase [Hugenholtzia roseola]|uniref:adenylosuccinate lyase n=1 Tax=Hugenholtzia roseola TaxID=1002 RepID=UPI000403C961|nr:adenylosuccinate lyase [Hugenholtzia roseola]